MTIRKEKHGNVTQGSKGLKFKISQKVRPTS